MNNEYIFKQLELNYTYDALEPTIDRETMQIHYEKHYLGYLQKTNNILLSNKSVSAYFSLNIENIDKVIYAAIQMRTLVLLNFIFSNNDVSKEDKEAAEKYLQNICNASLSTKLSIDKEEIKSFLLDTDKVKILHDQIGGYINHSFFWNCLTDQKTSPSTDTLNLIQRSFENIDNMWSQIEQQSAIVFGSGWIWMIYDKKVDLLKICDTANQNNPFDSNMLSIEHAYPIFCIDLWEHAYYLKYKNDRMTYVKNIRNIVNWSFIDANISYIVSSKIFE